MPVTYMTRQQQAVLEAVRRETGGVTAAALTEALHRCGESVGLTTVYRQLERLAQRGLVHKIVTDEGTYYQYCDARERGQDCFLLKCRQCGRVTHADCSHLGELYRHLEAAHGFTVDPRQTLFYGLCARCRQEAGS